MAKTKAEKFLTFSFYWVIGNVVCVWLYFSYTFVSQFLIEAITAISFSLISAVILIALFAKTAPPDKK